jgi:hypothetical protein
MRTLHLYEVKTLDGNRFRGEIAYRDGQKVILKLRQRYPEQKLRLFKEGILSIHDVGWQRVYVR